MLNTQESTSLTRSYAVKDGDQETPLVVISGRINPGQMLSIALMVSSAEAVQTHQADVAAAFDAFLSDIRSKAREHEIPV